MRAFDEDLKTIDGIPYSIDELVNQHSDMRKTNAAMKNLVRLGMMGTRELRLDVLLE